MFLIVVFYFLKFFFLCRPDGATRSNLSILLNQRLLFFPYFVTNKKKTFIMQDNTSKRMQPVLLL